MSTTPSMANVVTGAISSKLKGVRVALPARVESYDSRRRCVAVQPLLRDGFLDENGDRQTDRLPIINDVPIVFPGSGGARIRFPISKGDTVLLVFSSSSLDKWLTRGGELDPGTDHRHSLTDAIAIPGLQDFAHASDASSFIEFTAQGMKIGAGAASIVVGPEPAEFTFKATTFLAAFDTLIAAIAAAVATVVSPSSAPIAGAAITTALGAFSTAVTAALTTVTKVG